jgi:hypothetical protein
LEIPGVDKLPDPMERPEFRWKLPGWNTFSEAVWKATHRKRGRPRGSGLLRPETLAALREDFREHRTAIGRPPTQEEFAKREGIAVDTLRERLRAFDSPWPPE